MTANHSYPPDELGKPVTLGVLLEYTDEFLIPKIGEIIKEEVGASEHRMKSYIDDKLADYTSDIFKRLDKKYAREKEFKTKVVALLRKYKIGTPEEIAYLEGLSEGT